MGIFGSLFGGKKRAEEEAAEKERQEAAERVRQEEARKAAEKAEAERKAAAAKAERERLADNFKRILQDLPSVEITPSDVDLSKRSFTEEFNQIKFSSITAKTDRAKLSNFVVIDTETTGLKAASDEIIDVAAIRFRNWEPVEKFSCLCSVKKAIPAEIIELTGITDEMIAGKPRFGTIAQQLTEFIGSDNIVAHNAEFDLKFLICGGVDFLSKKRKYYDTLEIAQHTLKKIKTKWDKDIGAYCEDYESDYDVENYKLSTLCKYYGIIQVGAHRAENDVLPTGVLFQYLAKDRE